MSEGSRKQVGIFLNPLFQVAFRYTTKMVIMNLKKSNVPNYRVCGGKISLRIVNMELNNIGNFLLRISLCILGMIEVNA